MFVGGLCEKLEEVGKLTTSSLAGQVGWFKLRVTNNEFIAVLDAAYRRGYVNIDGRDSADKPIPTGRNVELTDSGRALKPPRRASAPALGKAAVIVTQRLLKLVDKAGTGERRRAGTGRNRVRTRAPTAANHRQTQRRRRRLPRGMPFRVGCLAGDAALS